MRKRGGLRNRTEKGKGMAAWTGLITNRCICLCICPCRHLMEFLTLLNHWACELPRMTEVSQHGLAGRDEGSDDKPRTTATDDDLASASTKVVAGTLPVASLSTDLKIELNLPRHSVS